MKQHRSAQGKMIDMAALAARNEKVRAVGNMKVNARGDTIDATGKVVVPVTQKVGAQYQKTVGNRSANAKKASEVKPVPPPKVKEQLTEEEMDLEASFNDDLEVEQIKAKEKK
jgi:hypothetical protein